MDGETHSPLPKIYEPIPKKNVKTCETCEKFFKHNLYFIQTYSQLTVVFKQVKLKEKPTEKVIKKVIEKIKEKPFDKVIDKSH